MASPPPSTSPLHPLRADLALVERGLVRSRTLARRLIEDGAVRLGEGHHEITVTKAAQPVWPDQPLRVLDSDTTRFVSRGGNKLEALLQATGLDCRGLDALDVGMSTGGFTDCLLNHGVRQVLGIEVGHGQLDPRLQADPRVACLEHTHIRDVRLASLHLPDGRSPDAGFALIVVDLSFIAASQLLGHLATLAAANAWLLCLIKPQFELGPDARNKQGIVRADADIEALRQSVFQRAEAAGWQPTHWQPCALVGGDGNQEYFLVARRTAIRPVTSSHAP
ncbi:MAG: TlyA family RNA methyltransferase [Lautropia sp.]|nr:TlyA family RNA methyltransferase [Lautropia sp.]